MKIIPSAPKSEQAGSLLFHVALNVESDTFSPSGFSNLVLALRSNRSVKTMPLPIIDVSRVMYSLKDDESKSFSEAMRNYEAYLRRNLAK